MPKHVKSRDLSLPLFRACRFNPQKSPGFKYVLHERYISEYQRVTPLRVAEKKIIY